MRLDSIRLVVPSEPGNGVVQSVRDLREKYIQVGGDAFTGTLRLEVSLNGSDYVASNEGDITAAGIYVIPEPALYVRVVNVSLVGTPWIVLNGYNIRVE